jgi:methyl-accepting chemotaxis protein
MIRISTDIQNLGSGQAASVEQTSVTLHEITSIVNQNAEASKHALKEAQDSFKSAQDGEREIGSLYKAMLDISASAKRIEDVTQVVDDIAFQINLLALNAAVEAARAGEQGKGFAVVADAVRSLAQRSATAAKDINLLIKESVSKIDNGNNIVESNRVILSNLLSSAEKVKDINSEIANSSKEQATSIGQISQAMNEIDSKANEAAKSSEEATVLAQKLSEQSALLHVIFNTFENEIIGDNHRSA